MTKRITKFPESYVVCTCRNVTLGEIVHAITEQGAKDVEAIEWFTDAGSVCGRCNSPDDDNPACPMDLHLSDVLKRFTK